jgi:iron complex transport system permease protein
MDRRLVLALSCWLLASVLALKYGAVPDAGFDLVLDLRFPRVLLATAVGAGLAVSGAVLQALFANPLCEPYTLGISSGAAVGAVIGAAAGMDWSVAGLAGSGFAGALVCTGALYAISLRVTGNFPLLLAGVMLGFLGSSLVALWMALADSNGFIAALSWLLGDLSRARAGGAAFVAVAIGGLLAVLWTRWRQLDAFLLGSEAALSLGVPVARARRRIILLTSLVVGICVSASGMIGFVGLVVPHFVRRFEGALHYRLIPLCAIWGAAALVGADALARVAARPYELPVGVVTALAGAPLFLWVMLRRRGETA